ncbi:MAG: hypothetical protein CME70_14070 [Halobacteriovorax sp.]|nr:hypothetical protein [Halobacteriovorax sp.]
MGGAEKSALLFILKFYNMGCDIHGFWEIKDHTGNWMAISSVYSQRDYVWFGIIAAVRGGPHIGTAARGIPNDPSIAYKGLLDAWGEDLHSHTWLTPKEVQEACQEYETRALEYHDDYMHTPGTNYETIPSYDTPVTRLITSYNHDDLSEISWTGTVHDLMHPDGDVDSNIRMVICFDS